jgi:hypothetical protein
VSGVIIYFVVLVSSVCSDSVLVEILSLVPVVDSSVELLGWEINCTFFEWRSCSTSINNIFTCVHLMLSSLCMLYVNTG